MTWRRPRPIAAAVLAVICAATLCGCSVGYVLRAGYEEARILWRREPIEALLRQPQLDASTRSKLELVLAVRRFAAERLHLNVNGSFGSFARVDRDQVVHVVSAAHRLRLEPYTWWFPLLGRVPYKGYFSEAAARAEVAALERDGYDTYRRPSVAFSTLGWFADPLLSNLLRYDRATLADILIHELLHNTMYVGGHADFDESLANFVGHRGAIAFFTAQGDATAAAQVRMAWQDALAFSEFLADFAQRLRAAYAAGATLESRPALFDEGRAEARRLPLRTNAYDDFLTEPINNAVILHYLMYSDRLRLFDAVLEQAHDDLAAALTNIIAAVKAQRDDPFAAVAALARPAAAAADGMQPAS